MGPMSLPTQVLPPVQAVEFKGSGVFNVGTGTEVSLNGLVEILNRILKKEIKAKYVINDVKNYISAQMADISKIRKELGYEPGFMLEAGIRDMLSQ